MCNCEGIESGAINDINESVVKSFKLPSFLVLLCMETGANQVAGISKVNHSDTLTSYWLYVPIVLEENQFSLLNHY